MNFKSINAGRKMSSAIKTLCAAVLPPLIAIGAFEFIQPYPGVLKDKNFPLKSRYFLRMATFDKNIEQNLNIAYSIVCKSSLGISSPEATSILVYLAEHYLHSEEQDTEKLNQLFSRLMKKPHVGEGITEELMRLDEAIVLCQYLYSIHRGDPCRDQILKMVKKLPSYFPAAWKEKNSVEKLTTMFHQSS